MGFRFRKSVKIFPGCRLNIGKSGLSVSLGVPGATVNLGRNGARTTVGLPGTGLSYSVYSPYGRRSPGVAPAGASLPDYPAPNGGVAYVDPSVRVIESVDTEQLTSATLTEVQDVIVNAASQRQELATALSECIAEGRAKAAKLKHKRSWYGFLLFWLDEARLAAEVQELAEENEKLQTAYNLSQVDVSFDLDDAGRSLFTEVEQAFDALCGSHKKWDIVQEQDIDTFRQRSSANTAVSRKDIRLYRGAYETIRQANVPVLGNANGGEVMIFPGFLLVVSRSAIALVDYADLDIQFVNTSFTEEEEFPSDAQLVKHTWAKVNANGSPDRRFKDNYRIPVALYGNLVFKSGSGLNESWMFSNHGAAKDFFKALLLWQNLVTSTMSGGVNAGPAARPYVEPPAIPASSDGRRKAVLAAIDVDYIDWCLRDLEIAHEGMSFEEKIDVLAANEKVTGKWLLSELKVNQLRAIALAIFGETSGKKADLHARILAYFKGE